MELSKQMPPIEPVDPGIISVIYVIDYATSAVISRQNINTLLQVSKYIQELIEKNKSFKYKLNLKKMNLFKLEVATLCSTETTNLNPDTKNNSIKINEKILAKIAGIKEALNKSLEVSTPEKKSIEYYCIQNLNELYENLNSPTIRKNITEANYKNYLVVIFESILNPALANSSDNMKPRWQSLINKLK